MKKIEVNINLDPVNDGVTITETEPEGKREGALIISTDGNERVALFDEAMEVLKTLAESLEAERLRGTPFVVFYNKDRLITNGTDKCLIGSVMIMKTVCGSYYLLEPGEYEEAERAFYTRLGRIKYNGQEYSAMEVL